MLLKSTNSNIGNRINMSDHFIKFTQGRGYQIGSHKNKGETFGTFDDKDEAEERIKELNQAVSRDPIYKNQNKNKS